MGIYIENIVLNRLRLDGHGTKLDSCLEGFNAILAAAIGGWWCCGCWGGSRTGVMQGIT